jgi:TolB-like protein/DNA-binding winged helix-turn-helix (wHTH) protein/Tfp pilus assembly protein PilF
VKQVDRQRKVIRFGVFEADSRSGELRKQGRQVKLQEQPFQILTLLLARPGDLVTREELREKLWPADTFVDFEHGLNKAISKLREALGDDRGTPRYIETLPRRGYRFIAPVSIANTLSGPSESQTAPATHPDLPVTGSPLRPRRMTPAMVLLLGVLVVLVSVLGYRLARKHPRTAAAALAAPIRSLAVLPLQNLSGDKDQEYFADGMTDELITDLGQMSALRVISRTSVMHYKQTSKTLPEIGRELGADVIVEGTVFRSGNRVRITAQLVDTRTDRHLWAHAYERDLRDVITMQDEVARDIADEVRVQLTPQERARLTAPHPVNPAAHEAYLKGRYYWNQFTADGLKKSLPLFQKAIEKDPNYALGYSGLADYYSMSYVRFGTLSRNEACPNGEAAALKAVELDGSLAEGHQSLAALRLYCDWDWRGAESELKRAIQLNPNYAEAHRVYAVLLVFLGNTDEAVVEMQRAVENDPMSADITQVFGWVYYVARHYDQAIRQYQKAAEMGANRPEPFWGLGIVQVQRGQFTLAIGDYRKAVEFSRGAPWTLSYLGYAYASAGMRPEARAILRQLGGMSKPCSVCSLARALTWARLGDKQQAFAWLEQSYQAHEWVLIGLKSEPEFDGLRSDPRFQDLVRRIGL